MTFWDFSKNNSIITSMDSTWAHILSICEQLSNTTYENLTKIIRFSKANSASQARKLDDSFQNDLDYWMGGGTCFSMTWHLYQQLEKLNLSPRLLMGHKRKELNIHCALLLSYQNKTFLFDPGYLIFDPLEIPEPAPIGTGISFFPLIPNTVQIQNNGSILSLFTGSVQSPLKLRFEFSLSGVDILEFQKHWTESFHREMMTYPVLNRLDRKNGIQYYYQKGNLVTRKKEGSFIQKIEKENQVSTLSNLFQLTPEIVEEALKIIEKF